jgi:hypothetical protein
MYQKRSQEETKNLSCALTIEKIESIVKISPQRIPQHNSFTDKFYQALQETKIS